MIHALPSEIIKRAGMSTRMRRRSPRRAPSVNNSKVAGVPGSRSPCADAASRCPNQAPLGVGAQPALEERAGQSVYSVGRWPAVLARQYLDPRAPYADERRSLEIRGRPPFSCLTARCGPCGRPMGSRSP